MRTCLARIMVATGLLLSSTALAACERQDVKEAEKLGKDFRKNIKEIEERSDNVDLDI
jgi:hypothetical protein